MPGRRSRIVEWTARWGFAMLVGVGALSAAGVAWSTEPPPQIPSFALQAAAIYRLEVAVFAAVYLAAMALVLAFHNRAFSEIGTSGIRAQDVSGERRTRLNQRQ